jgi:hypothetical protein
MRLYQTAVFVCCNPWKWCGGSGTAARVEPNRSNFNTSRLPSPAPAHCITSCCNPVLCFLTDAPTPRWTPLARTESSSPARPLTLRFRKQQQQGRIAGSSMESGNAAEENQQFVQDWLRRSCDLELQNQNSGTGQHRSLSPARQLPRNHGRRRTARLQSSTTWGRWIPTIFWTWS